MMVGWWMMPTRILLRHLIKFHGRLTHKISDLRNLQHLFFLISEVFADSV